MHNYISATHWGPDKMADILQMALSNVFQMYEFQCKISPKFAPKDVINNIPAWVQIMVWHQPGDKPLSEIMMVSLLMHICITRPQWVKSNI